MWGDILNNKSFEKLLIFYKNDKNKAKLLINSQFFLFSAIKY